MRFRAAIGMMALVAACLVLIGGGAAQAQAQASTTCSWGGTPAEPTGTFAVSPGLTNTPAPEPLKFSATGALGGGGRCTGKMTFVGWVGAGSTGFALLFCLSGAGSASVQEFLYDKDGNLVGADQPTVAPPPADDPLYMNCGSQQGETELHFSAIVELFE